MQRCSTSTPSALFLSAVLLAACSTGLEDKPSAEVKPGSASEAAATEPESTPDAPVEKLAVDLEASKIGFRGAKLTGGHDGGFETFTGTAEIAGETPRSVAFEVDMKSTWSDAEKLTEHLRSPDFFDVEKFEKSTFSSTKIEAKAEGEFTHRIEGLLDLHGKQQTIAFPAKIEVSDAKVRGTTEFKINRKDFDIVYPGMPDDLIKDEVLIKLDLVFPRA